MAKKSKDVGSYIAQFDDEVRVRLNTMRAIVRDVAPEAVESISYGIAGYKLDGRPLVYFAGYKNHIGFYAIPITHEKFAKDFSKYKQGKGSVQFPLEEPLPKELVRKVIRFRKSELEHS